MKMFKKGENMGNLVCKKCGSNNVQVQTIAVNKKRGCFASFLWIILAIFTLGMIIWIPLLTKKGSKVEAYAVCQNCGHKWKT